MMNTDVKVIIQVLTTILNTVDESVLDAYNSLISKEKWVKSKEFYKVKADGYDLMRQTIREVIDELYGDQEEVIEQVNEVSKENEQEVNDEDIEKVIFGDAIAVGTKNTGLKGTIANFIDKYKKKVEDEEILEQSYKEVIEEILDDDEE